MDEMAIERIVTPYVRYDIDDKEITFLSAFSALSIKAKVLVYLVALQGWKFVTEGAMESDARPADIESATGIPGGSLRPALRTLCENHVIAEKDSRYSVKGTSLPAIEAELVGGDATVIRRGSARAPKVRQKDREVSIDVAVQDASSDVADVEKVGARTGRKVAGKTGNVAATFERWIAEGYFDEPRTLAEVQKRFRKEAIMVPQTSLPGYFLSAVRKGKLTRDETLTNGKTVWAYTTNKRSKAK
jgi:hypothetical protein